MRPTITILTICILIFLLLPLATATCPDEPEDCTTSEGLQKMSNPSTTDFNRLDGEEQKKYLLNNYDSEFAAEYLSDSSFQDGSDVAIGDKYFGKGDNINDPGTREARIKYFEAKGYDFKEIEGDVKSWNPNTGTMKLAGSTANLNALKDDYSFRVANGQLHLTPKDAPEGSASEVLVEGDVSGTSGNVKIDGKIGGKTFIGTVTSIDPDKTVHGTFKQVGSTVMESRSPAIYSVDDRYLATKDSQLTSVDTDMSIYGSNLGLPDGSTLRSGKVSWLPGKKGWEGEYGTKIETPNKELVTASDNAFRVYTDTADFDPESHSDESYYVSGQESASLHTASGDKMSVEYLPGNKMMHIFKKADASGSIWKKGGGYVTAGDQDLKRVPDKRQRLEISAQDEQSLSIQHREDKIPLLSYSSSESGRTTIQSGRLNFRLEQDMLSSSYEGSYRSDPASYSQLRTGKYRSVPFQLETSSQKLLVNSANQFKTYWDNQETSMNDYGIEISADAEDNYGMRSLDALRHEYPDVDFSRDWMQNDDDSDDALGDVQPSTLQIVDKWLNKHPQAREELTDISFNQRAGADAETNPADHPLDSSLMEIGVGERLIDYQTFSDSPVRDMEEASTVLDHEYEHISDRLIRAEEGDAGIPTEQRLQGQYNNIVQEEHSKLTDTPEYQDLVTKTHARAKVWETVGKLELAKTHSDEEWDPYTSTLEENRVDTLKQKVQEFREAGHGSTIEAARQAMEEVAYDPETAQEVASKAEKLAHYISQEPTAEGDSGSGAAAQPREVGKEGQARTLFRLRHQLKKMQQEVPSNTNFFAQSSDELEQMVEEETDVKYPYSFRDYGSKEEGHDYSEISATFAERRATPDERQEIKQTIKSENSGEGKEDKTMTKLAHLAFDSGKMSGNKFRELMPEGYCEEEDCCDRKCEVYTATCEATCN